MTRQVRMTRQINPCSMPGCEGVAESIGYCHLHYQRIRYTGSPYKRSDPRFGTVPTPVPAPKVVPSRYGTMEEKFWALVDRTHPGACWEWTGPRIKGYPRLNYRWQRVLATRYSWELHHGPIPDGHKVISPPGCWCVNPAHLDVATESEISKAREARERATRDGAGPGTLDGASA